MRKRAAGNGSAQALGLGVNAGLTQTPRPEHFPGCETDPTFRSMTPSNCSNHLAMDNAPDYARFVTATLMKPQLNKRLFGGTYLK